MTQGIRGKDAQEYFPKRVHEGFPCEGQFFPSLEWCSTRNLHFFGALEQHCTTLYNIVQHRTTSYNNVQHRTTSYNIVQHHTTSYNIVQHRTTLYNILQHRTTSYNIVQQRATPNKLVQHCTTLFNIVHHWIMYLNKGLRTIFYGIITWMSELHHCRERMNRSTSSQPEKFIKFIKILN